MITDNQIFITSWSFKVTLFLIILFINCAISNNEIVMVDGMTIHATNPNGEIIIEAGKNLWRSYRWNDQYIRVRLRSRWSRWNGSKGAYLPGSGSNVYTIIEEGQQHFYSEEDIYGWLDWQNDRLKYVYTSDGLVVGWCLGQGPGNFSSALTVELWQIYINGKKPNKLVGSKDDLIQVIYNKNNNNENSPGKFIPSEPQIINGRRYSGKAIDFIKEYKISFDHIERCIAYGDTIHNDSYYEYYVTNPFITVKTDYNGNVILVTR